MEFFITEARELHRRASWVGSPWNPSRDFVLEGNAFRGNVSVPVKVIGSYTRNGPAEMSCEVLIDPDQLPVGCKNYGADRFWEIPADIVRCVCIEGWLNSYLPSGN